MPASPVCDRTVSAPLQAHKAVGQAIGCHMAAARGLLPLGARRGCEGVAFVVAFDFSHLDAVGQRQGLGVDLGTAHDPHVGGCLAAQRQGLLQAGGMQHAGGGWLGCPVRLARDHDVGAPGQRPEAGRQRVPGLAAHDHGRALGQLLEVRQVLGQVPGHGIVLADDAVGGACVDEMDGHRAGLSAASDGHGGLDGLVVLVADDLEVLVLVAEDGVGPALDLQRRVGEGLACQLGLDLGEVVVVDVFPEPKRKYHYVDHSSGN